jgi:hypothetical protein
VINTVARPYLVSVVVDGEYGAEIATLLDSGPVWAVDTQTNRTVAADLWAKFPDRDHLDGVTIFQGAGSPEETLINKLDTIDMHHNAYSADPPYTILQVFGTVLTARIETELRRYGFDSFSGRADGFRATRFA